MNIHVYIHVCTYVYACTDTYAHVRSILLFLNHIVLAIIFNSNNNSYQLGMSFLFVNEADKAQKDNKTWSKLYRA